jgi:hypothetical protein
VYPLSTVKSDLVRLGPPQAEADPAQVPAQMWRVPLPMWRKVNRAQVRDDSDAALCGHAWQTGRACMRRVGAWPDRRRLLDAWRGPGVVR